MNNDKLKKKLNNYFINDLKIVVDIINIMFGNERYNYNIIFNKAKIRLPLYVKKLIFQNLFIKVSLFVLRKMLSRYLKVINHDIKSYIK